MKYLIALPLFVPLFSCKNNGPTPVKFKLDRLIMKDTFGGIKEIVHPNVCCNMGTEQIFTYTRVMQKTPITFSFSESVNKKSLVGNFIFKDTKGVTQNYRTNYKNGGKVMIVQPDTLLADATKHTIILSPGLKSSHGDSLQVPAIVLITTNIAR